MASHFACGRCGLQKVRAIAQSVRINKGNRVSPDAAAIPPAPRAKPYGHSVQAICPIVWEMRHEADKDDIHHFPPRCFYKKNHKIDHGS